MNFDFQYVISADFLVLRLFIFYRGHPTQDYATTYGDNVTAIIFESTERDRLDIPDMDDFVSTQNTWAEGAHKVRRNNITGFSPVYIGGQNK